MKSQSLHKQNPPNTGPSHTFEDIAHTNFKEIIAVQNNLEITLGFFQIEEIQINFRIILEHFRIESFFLSNSNLYLVLLNHSLPSPLNLAFSKPAQGGNKLGARGRVWEAGHTVLGSSVQGLPCQELRGEGAGSGEPVSEHQRGRQHKWDLRTVTTSALGLWGNTSVHAGCGSTYTKYVASKGVMRSEHNMQTLWCLLSHYSHQPGPLFPQCSLCSPGHCFSSKSLTSALTTHGTAGSQDTNEPPPLIPFPTLSYLCFL